MKRLRLKAVLAIALLLSLALCGCRGRASGYAPQEAEATSATVPQPPESDTAETASTGSESTEAGTAEIDTHETETAEIELKKLDYEIDFHVISPFLARYYDEQTIGLAHKVIDAFLNDELETDTPDVKRRDIESAHSLIRYMCPPFAAFCEIHYDMDFTTVVNKITWEYRIPREEIKQETERFRLAIDKYMEDVYEDDTDAMKALSIYHAYCKNLEYDYDAYNVDEDASFYRTSPFCAITDHTGVCYNISEGLAFLYNMVGINAGSVGSYEGAGAHEWVIAQLDGQYYYFDATWESDHSECDSLTYFAITEEDRAGWAGGYPPESVVFAAVVPIEGEYDLSDARFEAIHGDAGACVKNVVPDHENQIAHIETDSGTIDFDMR